jgi:3-oxoacyl-[acyl-carrier-protein] synthase-3
MGLGEDGDWIIRRSGIRERRIAAENEFTSELAAQEALSRCNLTVGQIRCIIPHQSNRRIIDAFAKRIGATPDQVFVNLEKFGNTSAASIPIALADAVETGRVKPGDLILLVAFGSGLTWGAAVVEW